MPTWPTTEEVQGYINQLRSREPLSYSQRVHIADALQRYYNRTVVHALADDQVQAHYKELEQLNAKLKTEGKVR